MSVELRSRLRLADAAALGAGGLRSRPLRACLSALGVAIGIAAAVAVLGISASSRAGLLAQLASEGNLLTVTAGRSFTGQPASLPLDAEGMIRRIPPVESATGVGFVQGATVRRSPAVNKVDTGGIAVLAAQPSLLGTVGGSVLHGTFLNDATVSYPAVVLGFDAAQSLGFDRVPLGEQVDLAGSSFTVVGILRPVPVAPEIDSAALVGFPVASSLLGLDGHPTTIYLRSSADQVQAVAAVLPFTANPAQPEAVQVSRPSDVLRARAAAKSAFSGLLLGLGAVAVLVGGVGIANVMVVSVLERRGEIGLRRALGAMRVHVATQFLVESSLLALAGGAGGVALGAAAVAVASSAGHQPVVLPAVALVGGLVTAAVVGTVAGAYPALRAARLTPTEALRSA
jgi:putative ABC transport system permease protein